MIPIDEGIRPQARSFFRLMLWGALLTGFWNHTSQVFLLLVDSSLLAFVLSAFLLSISILIGFTMSKGIRRIFTFQDFSSINAFLILLLIVSVIFSYVKVLGNGVAFFLCILSGFPLGILLAQLLEESDLTNLLRRMAAGISIGAFLLLSLIHLLGTILSSLLILSFLLLLIAFFVNEQLRLNRLWPIFLCLFLIIFSFFQDTHRFRMMTGEVHFDQFRSGIGLVSISKNQEEVATYLGQNSVNSANSGQLTLMFVDELIAFSLSKPRVLIDLKSFLLMRDHWERISPKSVTIILTAKNDQGLASKIATQSPFEIQTLTWDVIHKNKRNSQQYDLIILREPNPFPIAQRGVDRKALVQWKNHLVPHGLLALMVDVRGENLVGDLQLKNGNNPVFRNSSVVQSGGYALYCYSDFVLPGTGGPSGYTEEELQTTELTNPLSGIGGVWRSFLRFMEREKLVWFIILAAGLSGSLFLASYKFSAQTLAFSSVALVVVWISICLKTFLTASGDSFPHLFSLILASLIGFIPGVLVRTRMVKHLDTMIMLFVALMIGISPVNLWFSLFISMVLMFGLGIRLAHVNRLIPISLEGRQRSFAFVKAALFGAVFFIALMGILIVPLYHPNSNFLLFILVVLASLPSTLDGRIRIRPSV